MISNSPDAMKVQKSFSSANVNVDGKHLKQIKKKVFNSPFRKRRFSMWPMKNGVKMKKRTGSRNSLKRKWCYCSYDHVGGAGRLLGRLLVSLWPVKVNLVVYLG